MSRRASRTYAVFDNHGYSVDGGRQELSLDDLASHQYRAMIAPPEGAPPVWVIRLSGQAIIADLPQGVLDAIAELASARGSTLLIGCDIHTVDRVMRGIFSQLAKLQVGVANVPLKVGDLSCSAKPFSMVLH